MPTTLKNLGVTPDFMVHHRYPQWTNPDDPGSSSDNDAALLQSAANWAVDAADLRQQISDYFGSGGTNIELVVTENNSDSGAPGKQSTSLINGLYYAVENGADVINNSWGCDSPCPSDPFLDQIFNLIGNSPGIVFRLL